MAREKFPSDETDRLMIRFPEGMRDRIAETARRNNRSMNAEIVKTLEREYGSDADLKDISYGMESVARLAVKIPPKATVKMLYDMIDALNEQIVRFEKMSKVDDTESSRDR